MYNFTIHSTARYPTATAIFHPITIQIITHAFIQFAWFTVRVTIKAIVGYDFCCKSQICFKDVLLFRKKTVVFDSFSK